MAVDASGGPGEPSHSTLIIRGVRPHGNAASNAVRVSYCGAYGCRAAEKGLQDLDIGERRDRGGSLIHCRD